MTTQARWRVAHLRGHWQTLEVYTNPTGFYSLGNLLRPNQITAFTLCL